MKNQKMPLSCHSCGKEMENSIEGPPCEVLRGWLTVSCWKGLGYVEHYTFCSFSCLKAWVDAQVPRVPQIFLESFKEDES